MPTRALPESYRQRLERFPDRWHKLALLLAAVVAVTVPLVADARWLTVANLSLVAVVGAVGLMILTGFAGQISLGHAAFMALGGYTSAVLAERFQLPFFLILPLGGLVAAAIGLFVGVFALRLKGLYLAIVTLGLTFIVNHVLLSLSDLSHGLSGITVESYVWFGVPFDAGESFGLTLYLLFAPLALFAAWLAHNIRRAPIGRAMMAVRDHDLAAAALGMDPARIKVAAFALSSFLAGIAGGMFAMQQQYLTVNPPFNLHMSVDFIAMIVLGGVGTVFGAVSGALVYTALGPLLERLGGLLPVLTALTTAQRQTVLFSLLVLALLVFEPLGLFGIYLRLKRYFATWPFRH